MRAELQSKILRLLTEHMPLTEESQAVYLFVEIRKVLDRGVTGKYPLLRFYADWCVHTQKDRITAQIKVIMEAIYKEILARITQSSFVDPDPKLIPFISMEQLRKEMDALLQELGLPTDLVERGNWPSLQTLLANILTDQLLKEPCDGIRSFAFRQAAPGAVIVEVEYVKKSAQLAVYRIAGAF